ncbi:chain-length determining protein [Brevundimonas sp.]|uniref:chain-length determining protein n=1 Tax=Brevundimonas sp. TaxID=1871086 RepID=UPI002FC60F29
MVNKIEYMGPLDRPIHPKPKPKISPVAKAFGVIVVLPTIAAAVYYIGLAAPQYESEARFVVRSAEQNQPSAFGLALQGVGISGSQTDVFAVHEYIKSRDGMDSANKAVSIEKALGRPVVDFLARYPRFWESKDVETEYKAYLRHVTVGYDSTTGISTLRVRAFAPTDSEKLAVALLDSGEVLVNSLNQRSYENAIKDAGEAVRKAELNLLASQNELSTYRNQEAFVDPARTAQEANGLITDLLTNLAVAKAERSQMMALAPQSPELARLNARIRAFEAQISEERMKIAGNVSSLASKIGEYERLELNREVAGRELVQARTSREAAERQASSQKLYLQRIVEPKAAAVPTYPNRLRGILTVLTVCFAAFSLGWLVWASIREHRHA